MNFGPGPAPIGFQQLDDGAWTDTSYNHTGLTAGKTYFYTVRAVLTGGVNGPWSEYVSAIFEPSLPAPVLTAEAGEGKVELSWGAVQGAERYEQLGLDQRGRLAAVGRRRLDRHDLQTCRTHGGHDLLLHRCALLTLRARPAPGQSMCK